MPSVPAIYFDGRDARSHAVTLDIAGGVVSVLGDGVERRESVASIRVTDVLGAAPRVITFGDGAVCEVRDANGLTRLLGENGIAPSPVSQWEGSLAWIVSGAVAFAAVLVLAYWYGIPLAARFVADRLPASVVGRLSSETLSLLDRRILAPTAVPSERRDAIAGAFRLLALPAGADADYTLVFRKSEVLGANAFALPSGTIVVTDGLVMLTRDDRELLGVLAHEAGHVAGRHGLRNVLQNSIVGLAAAWFIGDVSTMLAAAPAALVEASYSRDLEREADAYAIEVMRANAIPLHLLADVLRRLEESHGGMTAGALGYLSSHPATPERLQRLEAADSR
jgi:Zn-dependent protease with chaperone function